jgi:hypothetical protein
MYSENQSPDVKGGNVPRDEVVARRSKGMEALKLKYLDWYAPNIGLIKTEVWERGLFGRKVGNVELQTFGGSGGQS